MKIDFAITNKDDVSMDLSGVDPEAVELDVFDPATGESLFRNEHVSLAEVIRRCKLVRDMEIRAQADHVVKAILDSFT